MEVSNKKFYFQGQDQTCVSMTMATVINEKMFINSHKKYVIASSLLQVLCDDMFGKGMMPTLVVVSRNHPKTRMKKRLTGAGVVKPALTRGRGLKRRNPAFFQGCGMGRRVFV